MADGLETGVGAQAEACATRLGEQAPFGEQRGWPPGNSEGCENKWVGKKGICNLLKTGELEIDRVRGAVWNLLKTKDAENGLATEAQRTRRGSTDLLAADGRGFGGYGMAEWPLRLKRSG